jgi:N-acetylmuramoyl-L-alanine amidase
LGYFRGSRGIAAAIGLLFAFAGATPASAEASTAGAAAPVAAGAVSASVPAASVAPVTSAVSTPTASSAPAKSSPSLASQIAKEAAWLHGNGWPLYALVDRYSSGPELDEEARCIAVAVYFEARGESLEGQLAVARVIMNRAASGRYPPSWCATVKQPWQFSFVRGGRFPAVDESSAAWARAQGVTRLAINNIVASLDTDVLWYHADYVAPSWGRRLSRVQKIGTHIFYRS